jgi:hypothetical protein
MENFNVNKSKAYKFLFAKTNHYGYKEVIIATLQPR